MAKTGTTWNFTYDADGLRTSRSNGTTTYNYVYTNGQLRQMTCGTNELVFGYGVDGRPYALQYNGTYYYYLLNLQGDVIGIANTGGTQVVSYTYDAWGDILSVTGSEAATLGAMNPLRYRGYVYDSETGLYYVQTRYYNPEIGRWINADGQLSTQQLTGANLFAYCNNNPLMYIDSTGEAPKWWQWVVSGAMVAVGTALVATGVGSTAGAALISAGANSIINSYVSEASGGSSDAGWVSGMISGGISGLGAGVGGDYLIRATQSVGTACFRNLAKGVLIALSFGAGGSMAGNLTASVIEKKQISTTDLLESAMVSGTLNVGASFFAGIGTSILNLPNTTTTSRVVASFLTTGETFTAEAIVDSLSVLISLFG